LGNWVIGLTDWPCPNQFPDYQISQLLDSERRARSSNTRGDSVLTDGRETESDEETGEAEPRKQIAGGH
jgi:hypothetical protein